MGDGMTCFTGGIHLDGLIRAVRSFADDEDGATAIEYAMIAAGIAVMIMGTVFALGPVIEQSLDTVLNAFYQNAGT